MNTRFKDLIKKDLLKENIKVFIDGEDVTNLPKDELNKRFNDPAIEGPQYEKLEIFQYSNKYKKWYYKKPIKYEKEHIFGINKVVTYYNISLTLNGNGRGIGYHRFVYAFFNDIAKAYNENNELMDICHKDHNTANNNIKNLIWDTRKNNLSDRTGATNQYGKLRRSKS